MWYCDLCSNKLWCIWPHERLKKMISAFDWCFVVKKARIHRICTLINAVRQSRHIVRANSPRVEWNENRLSFEGFVLQSFLPYLCRWVVALKFRKAFLLPDLKRWCAHYSEPRPINVALHEDFVKGKVRCAHIFQAIIFEWTQAVRSVCTIFNFCVCYRNIWWQ